MLPAPLQAPEADASHQQGQRGAGGANLFEALANAVREYLLKDPERTLDWFASREAGHPGVSAARMGRMLRGETQMQLTDVMFITATVPGTIDFAVQWFGFDLRQKNEEIRHVNYERARLEARLSRCTCAVNR